MMEVIELCFIKNLLSLIETFIYSENAQKV